MYKQEFIGITAKSFKILRFQNLFKRYNLSQNMLKQYAKWREVGLL